MIPNPATRAARLLPLSPASRFARQVNADEQIRQVVETVAPILVKP
jgi:hypothetical protein